MSQSSIASNWIGVAVPRTTLVALPANLVDRGVGQADGVEVVHDHPGMTQGCDQGT